MKILNRGCYFLLLVILAFMVTACGRPQPISKVEGIVGNIANINDKSIDKAVYQYPGYSVVLFHNDKFWQSKDMSKRISFFADRYWEKIRFCEFYWDTKRSGKKYGLTMLPTVILYHNGQELDRIKGIPKTKEDRESWNNDLNLWLLKNALEVKGNDYSGNYKYRFKNGSELQISNY